MKKTLFILVAAACALVSCKEESNIPSPGSNDHNYVAPQLDSIDADDDTDLIKQLEEEGIEFISVKQAIQIGRELPSNGISEQEYYIKGIVQDAPTWNVRNGKNNATFNIVDTETAVQKFYCYQVYDKDGAGWAERDYGVRRGNVIVLYAKIKNYSGTIENDYDAYVYASTWKAPEITTQGDGSHDNPFTINDLILLKNHKEGNYYVRGVIVGSIVNESKDYAADNFTTTDHKVRTNIVLADAAGTAELSETIPAKLVKDKSLAGSADVQKALNLYDNGGNVGQTVLLYGSLEAVLAQPGINNITYAEINGNPVGVAPEQ